MFAQTESIVVGAITSAGLIYIALSGVRITLDIAGGAPWWLWGAKAFLLALGLAVAWVALRRLNRLRRARRSSTVQAR